MKERENDRSAFVAGLQGAACKLQVACKFARHGLQVARRRLQVARRGLQVARCRLQVARHTCELQDTLANECPNVPLS